MRLLEFEAKQRLAAHGIPIPRGTLWPATPAGVERVVVKAQVPGGGRGKRGAVLFAAGREAMERAALQLAESRVGAHPVRHVYIEEHVTLARELYVAVFVDRDQRCYALLASPEGGVDVENAPANRLMTARVDPLLGFRSHVVWRLQAFLSIPEAAREAFGATVSALYEAARSEDAMLIEINPLGLTPSHGFVALDAKMIVDDNAAFRHPEWQALELAREGSAVDRRIAAAGATGIEIDPAGTLVAVVSGAGLMMATLDLLTAADARVRYIVDLGGTPLADRQGLVPIFAAVRELDPAVVFVNAYFQTALADDFARSIVEALEATPLRARVVVRLKGRNAKTGHQILAPLGFDLHQELAPAIDAAVALARPVPEAH